MLLIIASMQLVNIQMQKQRVICSAKLIIKLVLDFFENVDTLKSVLQSVMQGVNQYLRVSMNQ